MNKRILKTRELMLCALFAALIAIGAFIKIPVPVLPFTLQFLFTNLAGILLGRKLGAISAFVYMLVGLVGIPVFVGGGGPGYIMQPTFGYIFGFIGGSYVAGLIIEKAKKVTSKTFILAGFANIAVVYGVGMIYYYIICNFYIDTPIGIGALIWYCFVLCVPGDIAICFVSSIIGKRVRPFLLSKGMIESN